MGPRNTPAGSQAQQATSNDFNAWLQGVLSGNGSSNISGQTPANTPRPDWNLAQNAPPYTGGLDAQGRPTGYGTQPPISGTGFNNNFGINGSNTNSNPNTSFQQAFQNMLNGQVNDQSGANQAIQNSIGQGANTFGQNFANSYTNPNYQAADISQLGTNMLQGTGMADTSQIGNTALSKFNTQQGYGNTATSQYGNILNQLLGQGSSMAMNSSAPGATAGQANIGAGISLAPATQFDMNNPYFRAIQEVGDRSLRNSVADERARWGAQGAGSIGTGSQFAETNLQAAAAPQMVIAIQQALEGLQKQDLAERGTGANVGLTSRGQDAQVGIANANNQTQASLGNQSAGIQFQGNNNSLFSALLGATGQARGQDFQNQQTTNNQNIIRMQSGLEQSLKNAGFTNDRQAQDLVALIQNQGLGNNYAVNSAQQNSLNQQNNNLNSLNNTQFQNNFNQGNALNSANSQNFANNLNSNNYQANQDNWTRTLGLGQNVNNTANQNQSNILQSLMQAFGNQANPGGAQNQSTPGWQTGLAQSMPAIIGLLGGAYNNRRR